MKTTVIEQDNDIAIKVDHDICEGRILVCSLVGPAYIEKQNATKVALAIDPGLLDLLKDCREAIPADMGNNPLWARINDIIAANESNK